MPSPSPQPPDMSDLPLSGRAMPSSFDDNEDYNASPLTKLLNKLKREPLVPLGCVLTVLALTNAWRAMRRGDHARVQTMFRARVLAQGFTVLAVAAGGIYFRQDRHRERELWKLQQQKDAEEKRARWIHELEVRDEEDRAVREHMQKRRRRAADREAGSGGGMSSGKTKVEEGGEKAAGPPDDGREGSSIGSSFGSWFGRGSKKASAQDTLTADAVPKATTPDPSLAGTKD